MEFMVVKPHPVAMIQSPSGVYFIIIILQNAPSHISMWYWSPIPLNQLTLNRWIVALESYVLSTLSTWYSHLELVSHSVIILI